MSHRLKGHVFSGIELSGMAHRVYPDRYQFFSFLHQLFKLPVGKIAHLFYGGTVDEGKNDQAQEVDQKMDRLHLDDFSFLYGLLVLLHKHRLHNIARHGYIFEDGRAVASYFAHNKKGYLRIFQQQVGVFFGNELHFLFQCTRFIVEQEAQFLKKIGERFHHDELEQLFLAAEIISDQRQVHLSFFCNISRPRGRISLLLKYDARRGLYLKLRIDIRFFLNIL